MTPARTHPGQRYHIPLFAKLMVDAGVDKNLVRQASKSAQNYERVFVLMEQWYYRADQRVFWQSAIWSAVQRFESAPWYKRLWVRFQWFLQGVRNET